MKYWVLGITFLIFTQGCNSCQDYINTCWLSTKAHCKAHRCWSQSKSCYSGVCYLYDFRSGFIQGYSDVYAGKNACPPLLPPRHYWKPCFMNPEGHCRTIEWFNGYAHGAAAAGNNVGYTSIPISPQFTGGVPADAEHHIHCPTCPQSKSPVINYEFLNSPNAEIPVEVNTQENPQPLPESTNSNISLPDVPPVKPYD